MHLHKNYTTSLTQFRQSSTVAHPSIVCIVDILCMYMTFDSAAKQLLYMGVYIPTLQQDELKRLLYDNAYLHDNLSL